MPSRNTERVSFHVGADRLDNAARMRSVRVTLTDLLLGVVMAVLILGASGSQASATSGPSPAFTFAIDPSWSASDRAQLESWLDPNGPVMTTVLQVGGPPPEDRTITVVQQPGGPEGDYDSTHHQLNLASLKLAVLVHELNHAIRDRWLLDDAVWEEGLARAGETEDMRLLALKGIIEPGYFDYRHEYSLDEYYDQSNVPTVGAPYGNIYIEPALTVLRYDQAGYAFTKAMIEDPAFIAGFNAKLFTRPNGNLTPSELVALAAEVQPTVEGLHFADWSSQQHIFDTNQSQGCYLFQRAATFTVDMYCTDPYGAVTMQDGTTINLRIYDVTGTQVFSGSGVSSSYGWVSFNPGLNATTGRLKMVATAESPDGPVTSTFYRQSAGEDGVFGVVTDASTGTVHLSSPSGQFVAFEVPVANGAFAAPSLRTLRGQVVAVFNGEGMSARRTVDKDEAPYSVVMAAKPMPPPVVVTESASSVTQTSAMLNATVDPNGGAVIDCQFDYGTTTAYGSNVPCSPSPGSGNSAVGVAALVDGLGAGASYHFRVVAKNPGGASYGADQTFMTLHPPAPVQPGPGEQEPGARQGLLPSQERRAPQVPNAELASTILAATSRGTVNVKVSCPDGESTCTGTITLRTLTALNTSTSSHARRRKAVIVTLAVGSFKVSGGHTTIVKLHLSKRARTLLGHKHLLRARATIFARDPAGATHTARTIVTLRAATAARPRTA